MRLRQVGGRGQDAQGEDPLDDSPDFGIGGNQALVVQQRQIEAFADADSGSAGEQERVGSQIISSAQFLLEELIVVGGERSG